VDDATARQLTDWRRTVAESYARARSGDADPAAAHGRWCADRDRLFRDHPQTPLPDGDPMRSTGVPYWPYDPALRFLLPLLGESDGPSRAVPAGADGAVTMTRIGHIAVPDPIDATLDVWWLEQYGGGIFLPVRDGTAGDTTYGGGRYLLDTAKGADLGADGDALVIDFNFLYHPSCRYDSAWECPLAPAGNTISAALPVGERL
jgi:uncharacterized protein (DUF1684 family)